MMFFDRGQRHSHQQCVRKIDDQAEAHDTRQAIELFCPDGTCGGLDGNDLCPGFQTRELAVVRVHGTLGQGDWRMIPARRRHTTVMPDP